jgi:DNA ligase-1
MQDLKDGETFEMQGSAKTPYTLKNTGGVYSCDCMAWRNQSLPIDRRSCKHIRKLRGDAAEEARIGGALSTVPVRAPTTKNVPPLLLAHTWDSVMDPTGWWMSEKYDGCRALWRDRKFITRQGNEYFAPEWFTRDLPDMTLDGELWMGRKKFQQTSSIVRRQDAGEQWKAISFLIFDAPEYGGTFENRTFAIANFTFPYARWHLHQQVRDLAHVKSELARVEALGGEGLMLRKPGSLYEVGRSMTLLKVKSFEDAEAIVVGFQPGKGKHKGRVGAIILQMENGIKFEVGTGLSDKERENPPPIGATVKFKFQELTDSGVPRFPVFLAVLD